MRIGCIIEYVDRSKELIGTWPVPDPKDYFGLSTVAQVFGQELIELFSQDTTKLIRSITTIRLTNEQWQAAIALLDLTDVETLDLLQSMNSNLEFTQIYKPETISIE